MNPNPNPKIESYLVTMSWFTENKQTPAGAHGAGPAQSRTRQRPTETRQAAAAGPCPRGAWPAGAPASAWLLPA